MGFRCLIAEGSRNLMNGYDPVHVFENHLPTLLRHINLSEDLELRFSEKELGRLSSYSGKVRRLDCKHGRRCPDPLF